MSFKDKATQKQLNSLMPLQNKCVIVTGGNKKLPEQDPMLFNDWAKNCFCCCSPGVKQKCHCGVDFDGPLEDMVSLKPIFWTTDSQLEKYHLNIMFK